jgi:hypothetical protein
MLEVGPKVLIKEAGGGGENREVGAEAQGVKQGGWR